MRADVVDLLACPVCGGALAPHGRSVRCAQGHTFDRARQGYVNLAGGGSDRALRADTATMVADRAAVLEAGHFTAVTDLIVDGATAHTTGDGAVVDVGAGTGHHLAAVLDALPRRIGLALDLSVYAARRAARCHPRAGAAVCDAWAGLPVRDGVAATALSVFAPRNPGELARILAPTGALLVVTPEPAHLTELVAALSLVRVDPDKDDRLDAQLAGRFRMIDERRRQAAVALVHADVARVVGMGPSAWHVDVAALSGRIAGLPEPMHVTVAVRLTAYRPVAEGAGG